MKLSEDGQKYAESLRFKSDLEIRAWAEEEKSKIIASRTQSNPKLPQMTDYYVERARRIAIAIVSSYVEAYKIEDSLIDDEDENEIIEEIRSFINTHVHHINNSITNRDFRHPYTGEKLPNMDEYLASRIGQVLGEAAIELRLAKNQMVMERKKKERDSQSIPGPNNYTTNIHGDNYGNIQQGGQGNTQNITGNKTNE